MRPSFPHAAIIAGVLVLALQSFVPFGLAQEAAKDDPAARLLEEDEGLASQVEAGAVAMLERLLRVPEGASVESFLLAQAGTLDEQWGAAKFDRMATSAMDPESVFLQLQSTRLAFERLIARLADLPLKDDARTLLRNRFEPRAKELAQWAQIAARRVLEARKESTDPATDLEAEDARLAEAGERKGWPQFRGAADRCNWRRVFDPISVPKILWRAELSRVPAVVGDEVYTGGPAIRKLALRDGNTLGSWRPEEPPDDFGFTATPVVLDDRVVDHASDGIVYAVDRSLTRVLWKADVRASANFAGAYEGGLYVVPVAEGVVALDVSDGSVRWRFSGEPPLDVKVAPAISEGRVFLGSWDGRFFALSLKDGAPIWSFKGEDAFGWTDPVVAFGKVFVGDRGGVVHAFGAADGREAWKRVSGATGLSDPGIFPGHILVGFGRTVLTLDEARGIADRRRFRTGLNPFGSPTIVGKTLYFGNLDGNLYAFDYASETLLWRFTVGDEAQVSSFVVHDDVVLVATTKGLFALGNDPTAERGEAPFVLEAE